MAIVGVREWEKLMRTRLVVICTTIYVVTNEREGNAETGFDLHDAAARRTIPASCK